ncbi:MAG TPA: hypothetical protein VGP64_05695 [Polyangia bacterium]|jgi:hypothetical protein
MEDQEGAPSDRAAAAPFSELVSAWLDEGDRLDETAIATAASSPPALETRARRILALARPVLERYRVVVLAGVGLIPFALFALTHRATEVTVAPGPVVAAATLAKVATPSASPLAWPERVAMAAEAPPPPSAAPPPGIARLSERAEAAPGLLEVASPAPRPALPAHHHHHHHTVKQAATCGLHVPCAVARPTSSGAHGRPVIPPRGSPAPTRSQPRR